MREFKNLFWNPAKGKFIFSFSYDAALVNEIKAAFDYRKRKWDPVAKHWEVDKDLSDLVEGFSKKFSFTIANSALAVLNDKTKKSYAIEIPDMPDLKINIPLRMEPFPFQKKGIAYNIQHRKVLIGDVPGLGKTVQTIGSFVALNLKPALIICPAHLKYNWKEEFEKWCDWRVAIMDDNIASRPGQWFDTGHLHAVIVNYEGLIKYFTKDVVRSEESNKVTHIELNRLATYFKAIAWDEIQDCNNPKTQRYKVSDAIRKLPNQFEMMLALSGTPIKSKVSELMYELRLINALDSFGGQTEFSKRYINYKKERFGVKQNPQNLEELNSLLRRKHYYRREKHEVLKELPDKFRQVIKVDITNRPEYDHAVNDFKNYLTQHKDLSAADLERTMRAEILVQMMNLMQISARGKLSAVKEFAKQVHENDEKLIVFAHHREIVEDISKQFPHSLRIVGGMQDTEKHKSVTDFQTDDTKNIIICSIKAASTGITLTAASKVAFAELPWTPDKIDQCEDRAHRIGQKNCVNSYWFLGANTIDEKIYKVLMAKRELSKVALGVNDNVTTQFHGGSDLFADLINDFR